MLKGGNDLSMPSLNNTGKNGIKTAINNGSLSMDDLDTAVRNFLGLVVKSPTFNGKNVVDNTKNKVSEDLAKANAALSRKAAPEGMVLLKNDKTALPFKQDVKTVGLVGNSIQCLVADLVRRHQPVRHQMLQLKCFSWGLGVPM